MCRLRSVWVILALAASTLPPVGGQGRDFEVRSLLAHGRRTDTLFQDFTGDGVPDALMVSIDFDQDPPQRWLALHRGGKDRSYPDKPDQIWPVPEWAAALAF